MNLLLQKLLSTQGRRFALYALVWAVILGVMVAFRHVLLPFMGAAFIAYVIEPLVTRLSAPRAGGRRIARWVCVIGLYLVLAAVVYLFILFVVPNLYRELAKVGHEGREFFRSRAQGFVHEVDVLVQSVGRALGIEGMDLDVKGTLSSAIAELQSRFLEFVGLGQRVVGGILRAVFGTFLILMLTAFISADWPNIRERITELIPRERRARVDEVLHGIDHGLAGVVRGQLTICLVNGVLTFIGLVLLDLKFAFTLAIVATVFSLVPVFGSIISSIPIALVALTDSFTTALLAVGWIVGIHALEAYLLNPKIMGDAAKIHPVVVVFALIAGEHHYGLVGALFAVPIASICMTLLKFALRRTHELEGALARERALGAGAAQEPR